MGINPAGLGVYKSSEWVMTFVQTSPKASTNWEGLKTETKEKGKVDMDNFAYVGSFTTGQENGIVNWSAGFSYNKVKDYRRSYIMEAATNMQASVSDYIAGQANGYSQEALDKGDVYNNGADWLSALGYQGGLIDYFSADEETDPNSPRSAFGDFDADGEYVPYNIRRATLSVEERGAVDHYTLAVGLNISNYIFAGVSMAITTMDYTYISKYDEKFTNDDYLYLDNSLNTRGAGYAVNIGAIVRPADYLRLGVAYRSPVWYDMTDYFDSEAGSSVAERQGHINLTGKTPEGAFYQYSYQSPERWIFSGAAIFGQSGLLSADYEVGQAETLRIGGELKVTPRFALRGGWSKTKSAVTNDLRGATVGGEGLVAGTIPHFTIDEGMTAVTLGGGYRITPSLYGDVAWVLSTYREYAYAFPVLEIYADAPFNPPALLKTQRLQVALTFGYKF
jgi:hypothetical protein